MNVSMLIDSNKRQFRDLRFRDFEICQQATPKEISKPLNLEIRNCLSVRVEPGSVLIAAVVLYEP
jgi:hypothetical protein